MSASMSISEARAKINHIDTRLNSDKIIYVTRNSAQVFALVDPLHLESMLIQIRAWTPKCTRCGGTGKEPL